MGGQFYRKGKLPEAIANTTLEQANAYELFFWVYTFCGSFANNRRLAIVLVIAILIFGIDQFFVTLVRNLY